MFVIIHFMDVKFSSDKRMLNKPAIQRTQNYKPTNQLTPWSKVFLGGIQQFLNLLKHS